MNTNIYSLSGKRNVIIITCMVLIIISIIYYGYHENNISHILSNIYDPNITNITICNNNIINTSIIYKESSDSDCKSLPHFKDHIFDMKISDKLKEIGISNNSQLIDILSKYERYPNITIVEGYLQLLTPYIICINNDIEIYDDIYDDNNEVDCSYPIDEVTGKKLFIL